MVAVVSMVVGLHTSVFVVTIQFDLCVTQHHGLRRLCGNVKSFVAG